MSIIIQNGVIVNADFQKKADILIENGKISKIGKFKLNKNDVVINANGKYVLPGGVDPHVHLNLPTPAGFSSDNFLTGTKAALFGGTTSIIDFVTPKKGQSLVDAYLERKKEAKKSIINVKFHVSPIEWTNSTASEMKELVEKYNVKSFKIYLAYKNSTGISDKTIVKVLETAKKNNAIVTAHCENDEIVDYLRKKYVSEGKIEPKYHPLSRPAEAEVEAIEKMILFAKYIGSTIYIVHVSTGNGINLIEKAQKQGVKVYAETCPHYLLLDDSVYEKDFYKSAKYVLSPPLRKKTDNEILWNKIKKGTVQTVGTDHCPFFLKGQKDIGKNDFTKIPNGAGSIENRLLLLFTYGVKSGKISIEKFVEISSQNPAKIFGYNKKGKIKAGFDADLYILNPDVETKISEKNLKQNSDNSIYDGFKIFGDIETIILNGKIIDKNEI